MLRSSAAWYSMHNNNDNDNIPWPPAQPAAKMNAFCRLHMNCDALLSLLLLFLWSTGACSNETTCRFALDYYDTDALLAGDNNATSSFLNDYIDMESNFMHLLGIDEDTMMMYNGQRLDYNTGMPIDQPKKFSAASKESLHVLMLSKALDGNTLTQRAFTREQALSIARTKVASYK